MLKDGRSASMHTNAIQVYAQGRVWYGMQQYVSSGGGSPIGGLVAFNREYPGMPDQESPGSPGMGQQCGSVGKPRSMRMTSRMPWQELQPTHGLGPQLAMILSADTFT